MENRKGEEERKGNKNNPSRCYALPCKTPATRVERDDDDAATLALGSSLSCLHGFFFGWVSGTSKRKRTLWIVMVMDTTSFVSGVRDFGPHFSHASDFLSMSSPRKTPLRQQHPRNCERSLGLCKNTRGKGMMTSPVEATNSERMQRKGIDGISIVTGRTLW